MDDNLILGVKLYAKGKLRKLEGQKVNLGIFVIGSKRVGASNNECDNDTPKLECAECVS